MEGNECTLDTDGDKVADYKVSKSFIICREYYIYFSVCYYIQCICVYALYI